MAIKVLSERFGQDELAIRRFKREARAAARVSAHPHVVTIFDVGDIEADDHGDPHLAFMVMEYLAGGTVADALRCNAVNRADTRRWLGEAASALDHAHARGIVHRDIKPANFLLDRERSLHVADFGIARLQSEDTITSSGELFGTAAYLSPEQALGREATGASDRYALAVCAFELLTGGRPFTAPHFAAQARQHIEAEPPRASERDRTLPPAVDDVLRRGMAKQPDQRYPTSRAFVDALLAVLDGDPTAVTEPLRGGRRGVDGAAGAGVAGAGVARAPAARAPAGAARAPAARAPAGAARAPAGTARASRTAATTPLRPSAAERTPPNGRAFALAALAVVAIGVIVLISQMGASSTPAAKVSSGTHSTATHRASHRTRRTTAASSSSSSTTAPLSSTASTPAAGASSPSQLQLLGHQQLLGGDYAAAISTLRRALAEANPNSLTYAYALYDLGDALLLSGNPKAAIPVLQQRLKIPNQTATVQALLNKALQEAGMPPQGSPGAQATTGGAGVPPGHHKGDEHGGGNGQGG